MTENSLKILLVDDVAYFREVMRDYFKRTPATIMMAASGQEALETALRESPDLIYMDVVMPGLNGFQATRELSRDPETSDIPVLMVTTKGDETDRIWGMRQGAADYLVKPITEAQLVERVKAVLEG